MLLVLKCVLAAFRQLLRQRGDLVLENLALRHQLEVLTRNARRRRFSRQTVCSGRGYPGCGRSGADTSSSCDPTPWSAGTCGPQNAIRMDVI